MIFIKQNVNFVLFFDVIHQVLFLSDFQILQMTADLAILLEFDGFVIVALIAIVLNKILTFGVKDILIDLFIYLRLN